ncbi:glycosyltransferase family 4 protein [Caldimonas brevitalea]|uniref:UDP-glucose:(Heptosyl)LPS alpha-1,3-glucosyltransferase n=1 Tax=Caldimonas brevitalea TaxID=413882 RepID=A0A0G3BES9_9BURK|nr:glycosyltransferase family 4 protein [Caldimonas brevitalea]AKJ27924.1 UDP-glucose:(heptosyl)LPS alpha-1,3-glucosyltransferase [Caldimonas brevitalea]
MSKQDTRVVVFDQAIAAASPAGSCVLAEIVGLAESRRITVFSDRCEVAQPGRIDWVRVPLPKGPIVLRYVAFQLLAPMLYTAWRLRGNRADQVQTTQGQYVGADIAYAHFCHRAYLNGPWKSSPVKGLRRLAREANHRFNAIFERRAFLRARRIVVPSLGLARELSREYPDVADRIVTIANPVDVARFARPADFDRAAFRQPLGLAPDAVVLSFMALGDFARKGLGVVIEALAGLPEPLRAQAQVLVIGGQQREIDEYQAIATRHGVGDRLRFVGLQKDVRPYLWAADVFAFPSLYEIFSLAILQAAAAGLPTLVTQGLYGAEEFVRDGENGWLAPRTPEGVRAALAQAIGERHRLPQWSAAAQQAVQQYSREAFVAKWQNLYAGLDGAQAAVGAAEVTQ